MRIVRTIVSCLTPLHCGGGADQFLDQPVTRDVCGFWRIPGSSVAGILRSAAARYASAELVNSLFGMQHGEESHASLVWCSDAQLLDYDGLPACGKALRNEDVAVPQGPYIRDHVRIDHQWGSAEEGGKFDEEIVPPGACFAFEIRLDGWNAPVSEAAEKLFDTLCLLLHKGEIRFGGKQTGGYGRVEVVEFQYREFDLFSERGMEAYLNLSDNVLFGKDEGVERPLPEELPEPQSSNGISGYIEIPLVSTGPLLVGGSAVNGQADMVCLQVPLLDYAARQVHEQFVVPGTSVKGVLRHRVRHVAEARGMTAEEAEALANDLFGSATGGATGTGQVGTVSVFDTLFSGEEILVQHVAIDRFTGGALDGALFNEAPVWRENVKLPLRLGLENAPPECCALLVHALLDMFAGEVPVGGGVNRGNGVLCLPGWREKGAAALGAIRCSLFWQGEHLSTGDAATAARWLERLEEVAP